MKTQLILTFTSPDRPGVIEKLTSIVVSEGGNWEESRLARLGGDFAGIVRIAVDSSRAASLSRRLNELTGTDLAVQVKVAAEKSPSRATPPVRLSCEGADHEGIVNRLTAYLALQGINVEEMESHVEPAPTTGTPVFRMECLLSLPQSVDQAQLRENLQMLASELAVDLYFDGEMI